MNWLSYTIIRVAGYNSDISTDSSVVRLQKVRIKRQVDLLFCSKCLIKSLFFSSNYPQTDEQKYHACIKGRLGPGDSQRTAGAECMQSDTLYDEITAEGSARWRLVAKIQTTLRKSKRAGTVSVMPWTLYLDRLTVSVGHPFLDFTLWLRNTCQLDDTHSHFCLIIPYNCSLFLPLCVVITAPPKYLSIIGDVEHFDRAALRIRVACLEDIEGWIAACYESRDS